MTTPALVVPSCAPDAPARSAGRPAAVTLAEYDAADGHIVVLRFAPGCRVAARSGAPVGADTSALARLSPTLEAALAAKHASAAAEGAVQAVKPSRRETLVALMTAVAVLLLK